MKYSLFTQLEKKSSQHPRLVISRNYYVVVALSDSISNIIQRIAEGKEINVAF